MKFRSLLVLWVLTAAPLQAYDIEGGVFVDELRTPVSGIKVVVDYIDPLHDIDTLTDVNGGYWVGGIPENEPFMLRVEPQGSYWGSISPVRILEYPLRQHELYVYQDSKVYAQLANITSYNRTGYLADDKFGLLCIDVVNFDGELDDVQVKVIGSGVERPCYKFIKGNRIWVMLAEEDKPFLPETVMINIGNEEFDFSDSEVRVEKFSRKLISSVDVEMARIVAESADSEAVHFSNGGDGRCFIMSVR